jgi:S1-C subfamily serine protease
MRVGPARLYATIFLAAALLAVTSDSAWAGQTNGESGTPDPFPREIARITRSIAPVICRTMTPEKPVERIVGTAFFVSAVGEFVTAEHVIDSAGECQKAVYLPVNGWNPDPDAEIRLYNFKRCLRDAEADIAVCRTDRDLTTTVSLGTVVTPVIFDTAEHEDGTPIAFTGFPLQIRRPLTARGFLAASHPGFMAGGLPRLVIDRVAWPGSSGGPVYGADGRVIGMMTERGIDRSIGLAFARPASLIVDIVTKFRQQNIYTK